MITESVHQKFPHLLNFGDELVPFIEKASGISFESILTDVAELEKGMELAKKEQALRKEECPAILTNFTSEHERDLDDLRTKSKIAQVNSIIFFLFSFDF